MDTNYKVVDFKVYWTKVWLRVAMLGDNCFTNK